MASNPTIAVACELLPGYKITERIGAGGYGEVFRATAPGGIEKAVKSLYGYHDDELAARELKALERIKLVRHPFLLSLDRFEVVDGRLIVVTELADGSLDDRFQECRQEGRPGIPRQELLGYLHDAAEALDYMQAQHGLQHLDVKPENLLLVGGHVKVADFGLVKDVAHASQYSQVGGLTPTYAAPELFDNRPGARSDQYSLAIVYQELLTGTLPFPGQSAAQLMSQHTQAEPRVSTLPDHDRPVIRRALAKDSDGRFESCRAMVEALASAAHCATDQEPSSVLKDTKQLRTDDTKEARFGVTERLPENCVAEPKIEREALSSDDSVRSRSSATEHVSPAGIAWEDFLQTQAEAIRPRKEETPELVSRATRRVLDASFPEVASFQPVARPTLLVALGGQAAGVLRCIQQNLHALDSKTDWNSFVLMLGIDTDRNAVKNLARVGGVETSPDIQSQVVPLQAPQYYRDQSSDLSRWLSRRWVYAIPRSRHAAGLRPLGRLALIDNANEVVECLADAMERLTDRERTAGLSLLGGMSCRLDMPRIVIVASTSGGTGSGMALDLAQAIRNIAQERDIQNLELLGILGNCCGVSGEAKEFSQVNTMAFLREYFSIGRQGNRTNKTLDSGTEIFEGDGLPFDHTYFISSQQGRLKLSVEQWIEQTAEYLTVDIASGCGPLFDGCRSLQECENGVETSDLVRSFAVAPLNERQEVVVRRAKENLCALVAKHWRRRHECSSVPEVQPRGAKARLLKFMSRKKHDVKQGANAAEEDPRESLQSAICKEFGSASDSEFATGLLQGLTDPLATVLENRLRDDESDYYADRLIHHAFQQLTAVVCQFASESPDGAVMSARCLKSAERDTELPATPGSDSRLTALVSKTAQQVCGEFLAALLESPKPFSLELEPFLRDSVDSAVSMLVCSEGAEQAVELLANCQTDLALVLESTAVGPPGCGHIRRALVVLPWRYSDSQLAEKVKTLLPKLTIVHGNVLRPLFIYEASGLSLPLIASNMCADRPELAEAAWRVQTRNDVEWLELPRVISEEDRNAKV